VKHNVWLYFLAGWLLSVIFSPNHLLGMFGKKSS
jgi:hypothetical protein